MFKRLTATLAVLILLVGSPAQAKSRPEPTNGLVEVTGFGPNPTGLQMHEYIPQSVRPHPAILVVLHYCTGSGPAMFTGTRFAALADEHGFIAVYPSATREGHCFDVSSPGTLTHNGNSDPVGIVSMVRHVVRQQGGNANRVFVTGISSGAMMTNVLLGDYPDVFKAGSAMSGVPFACFATTNGSMWNSECANGRITKTPKEWGDLARGAFPGYRGPRPRMQVWHGTLDTILFYPNYGEQVKQWTDVLSTGQTPTRVDNPRPTWTHSVFVKHGKVQVDAYSVEGGSHNLAFESPEWADLAVDFFGLS
ncbi:MAG TPA: PHB depolymerase family esterase [Candidatus Limnocylindrales bacterium]|nr:PHB depolymerase family esterase [Candidatus Limnocylindrales bacterium]